MTERFHYDYKIITESSCPSTEELDKFVSSRKYSWWTDHTYYSYILPTTKMLVEQALTRLQQEIAFHLNEGWKLQGSIFLSRKETKVYRLASGKLHSYDVISYSQAMTKEQPYEEYLKRTQGYPKEIPDPGELEEVKKLVLEIQAKLQTLLPPQETS